MTKRASGILLHPTSFYGNYGCGSLGDDAREIIDWLKKAGQKIIQVLPLGPTGYGDSPYQSFSAFAGTPYIISFDELVKKGLLNKNDLKDYPETNPERVDYYTLYTNNFKILYKAYENFKKKIPDEYYELCDKGKLWLNDYALFMALKDSYNGKSWHQWDDETRLRKNLDKLPGDIKEKADFYKFIQYEFAVQWFSFKKYVNDQGITIIGDAPIFVSYDSADVWANQELYYLDKSGKPEVVAGVPPDYFSATGQLWGNPIYKWDLMKKNGYTWWKNRIKHTLNFVDCLRIDHFRGFEAYWSIPYGEPTAVNGQWVKAPGMHFFNSLKKELGDKLPELIIAEDLGLITDKVVELRDTFNLPGMRIFEFANFPKAHENNSHDHIDNFSEDSYIPGNYIENCIAYPGTHDNDTLSGWFDSLTDNKKQDVLSYLKIENKDELNYAVINALMESSADRVVFLIQDILCLPTETRMNLPGTTGTENWSWRLTKEMLTEETAIRMHNITKKTGRI